MVSLNSGSWVLGLQEATTTRFSPCSLITSTMRWMLSWLQLKRFSAAYTTPGRLEA